MKNHLFALLLTLFVFNSYRAFSQVTIEEARYKYNKKEWDKLTSEKVREGQNKYDTNACLISVSFAKFTVDSAGNVDSLSIIENKGTPPAFGTILRSVVNATNGSWYPRTINGKAVKSRPFILPFIYDMEASCSSNHRTVNNATADALYLLLTNPSYSNVMRSLDCIILEPMIFSSAN